MIVEKTKILVAGHDLKFFQTIFDYADNYGYVDWIIDKWDNHTVHDEKESRAKLKEADIIFCEWGLGNILFFSNLKQPSQKLFIRIHLQELRVPYMEDVNWDAVDGVFFVAEWVKQEFSNKFFTGDNQKIMKEKSHYVPNVIDPIKFKPKPPLVKEKFNFGILGAIMKRKGQLKAVQLYHDLVEKYPEKTGNFFIQGHRPQDLKWMGEEDKNYEKLLLTFISDNNLSERVQLLPHGDPVEFFNLIDIVLSMSEYESFHYSIPDGMLSGCLPMIKGWKGARSFYPEGYIFEKDEEFDKIFTSFLDPVSPMLLYNNRSFIIERYGPSSIIPRLLSLMDVPVKPHFGTCLL